MLVRQFAAVLLILQMGSWTPCAQKTEHSQHQKSRNSALKMHASNVKCFRDRGATF